MKSKPISIWCWLVYLAIPVLLFSVDGHYYQALFDVPKPPGQVYYELSKLVGLMAFWLMLLQLMTGLLGHTQLVSSYWSQNKHKALGILTVAMIIAHIGLFVTAVSLRTGHISLGLLIPSFSQGYYKLMLAFGVMAFWLLTIVVLSGAMRTKKTHPFWRLAHKLTLVIYVFVLLHSLSIGSETRSYWVVSLYCLSVVMVGYGVWRFFRIRRQL